jgi:hypothetical protein
MKMSVMFQDPYSGSNAANVNIWLVSMTQLGSLIVGFWGESESGRRLSSSLNPKGFSMPHCHQEPAAYVGQLAEAARSLVPHIAGGQKLTRMVLNAAMEAATGSTSASGVWSQRDSFQMLEMVVIQSLREQSVPSTVVQALSFLNDLEVRLPTQTVRSEEQVEHQHFSTPLGLAWLATHLADIQPDDTVLEPSAGTGMLAIWAKHAATLQLNEIDPVRQEILRHLLPTAQVTGHDAARIGAHLTQRPSVVLMNPPFARNAAGLEDPTTAARHLAAALGV